MKKDNYLKFLLLMLAFLLPVTITAHDFVVDGIYYNQSGNNAIVTYQGTSFDQYSNEYSGNVTIPNTVIYNGNTYSVTAIGVSAFADCFGLTGVTIPTSVTTISESAFYHCTGLTSIIIPNSVTAIKNNVFVGCSGLASITVESDNPKYDSRENCNAIIETASNTLISGCMNTLIPNSVTAIKNNAFTSLTKLTNINIPHSVTAIGSNAFYGCSALTNINIPDSVTSINYGTFYGCSALTSINIPNSVTAIDDCAFANCSSLTSINIPDSVTSINYATFSRCSALTNVVLPNSITAIGENAFSGCSSLKSINIPNDVTTIGNAAFYSCKELTNIIIPNALTYIGENAFSFCYGLTNISIPSSVTYVGDGAFGNCYGLKNIEIGSSVIQIGDNAFKRCNRLTNVYSYATYPPTCFENTFEKYTATLHVPAASLAAYFTSPYWSNFENIIGDAVEPTGITISRDSVELQLGEQFQLTASVTPHNATCLDITWKSTDTNIVTVNDGCITVVGTGECDVIASCYGMQANCHVSVVEQQIIVSLDQQDAMLLPNHILTLTPTASIALESYMVLSSDPTVAAARVMNGKIQVVGIKEGTTTIIVDLADGNAIPATCLVTVYTEPGDLNSDGFVTIGDVTSLIDFLLGGDETSVTMKNADVNDDGNISIKDVTSLIDTLLSETE